MANNQDAKSKLPVKVESQLPSAQSPLQLYLRELSKYPLLDPEEEFQLAVKHHEQGDVEAAHRLITSNLRLVVKIANEFRSGKVNILDLVQEGNYGLMQAVKKFDPYKGVKLSSYAAWWIRAYILKYLMDSTSQVRIATTAAQRKLFYNLRKETERLLREYDEVTPKLLADNLNVREQDVLDMQIRLGSPDVSLDEPLSPDSDATREYLLADGSKAVDDVLADGQLLNIFEGHLLEFKSILNGRDLDIFNDRMLAEKPLTLQEIGERYGITRERARQIEARILKNLKEFVKEKGVMQDLMTPTQPAEYR